MLQLENIQEDAEYTCSVIDTMGAVQYAHFQVHVAKDFELLGSEENWLSVRPGESVALDATAVSVDTQTPIEYFWEECIDEYEDEWASMDVDSSESTVEVAPSNYTWYRCTVTQGENQIQAFFHVSVDSQFSVEKYSDTIGAETGDEVALSVNASTSMPELSYVWYHSRYPDDEFVMAEADADIVVSFGGGLDYYCCDVSDGYAIETIYFTIYENAAVTDPSDKENADLFAPGETRILGVSGSGQAWFKIEADKTGYYRLSGSGFAEGNVSVYDEEGNLIDSRWEGYFLTADESYLVSVPYEFISYDDFGEAVDAEGILALSLAFKNYDNEFEMISCAGEWDDYNDEEEKELCVEPGSDVRLWIECDWLDGSIHYQWENSAGEIIEGAEESEYMVENVTSPVSYTVTAADDFGNQVRHEFLISLRNDFTASAVETRVEVDPGEEVTLQVNASCREGEITYQWQEWVDSDNGGWETISGETSDSYTLAPAESTGIQAVVKDEYGNIKTIDFYVEVAGKLKLKFVSGLDEEDSWPVGKDYTFAVRAVTSDKTTPITYVWEECVYNDDRYEYSEWAAEYSDWVVVDGADTESVTITAKPGDWMLRCTAYQGDDEASYWFYYYGYTGLSVDYSSTVYAQIGKNIILAVDAVTNCPPLSYEWAKWDNEADDYIVIDGATSDTLEVVVTEGENSYRCIVRDAYSRRDADICINGTDLTAAAEISLDKTVDVVISDGNSVIYKFIPENTGGYKFYVPEYEGDAPRTWLTDSDSKQIGYSDYESDEGEACEIIAQLTAGETYYLIAGTWDYEQYYKLTVVSADQEVAEEVSELLDELSSVENITLGDKAAVVSARAKYNALTAAQKELISEETLKKLTDAEEKIAELEASAQAEKEAADQAAAAETVREITSLPELNTLTLENKAAVEAARAKYDALTDDQKAKVSAEDLKKLTDAEAKIVELSAQGTGQDSLDDQKDNQQEETQKDNQQAETQGDSENGKQTEDTETSETGTSKETDNAVKKGTTYTVSNMNYKVTNADMNGKGTVTLVSGTKAVKSKLTKLTIPSSVKINGASFKVTAVYKNAFKNYKKLKNVTIGANVTTIGASAFAGDTALTKVVVGKNVVNIGKSAFSGDKKLKTLTIKSAKLKTVGKNAIKNIYKKAVIKVPKKQLKKYKKLFKAKTGFKKTMKIKK